MKAYLILAALGPVLVLTNLDSPQNPRLLDKLRKFGKFIAYELPLESVKVAYLAHFEHVLNDPKQSDEYRVLDADSKQIYANLDLTQLRNQFIYQP